MVERMKRAIAPMYTDRCTVYEKRAVSKDNRTSFEETVKYENVPCRISAKAYLFGENAGSERDRYLKVSKRVKIFLPPEYEVQPGSRIEVKSKGRCSVFGRSGAMSFFRSHNEVMVEIMKDYA